MAKLTHILYDDGTKVELEQEKMEKVWTYGRASSCIWSMLTNSECELTEDKREYAKKVWYDGWMRFAELWQQLGFPRLPHLGDEYENPDYFTYKR